MPPMPSLLRQPSHRPAFSLQRSRSAAVLLAASLLFILPAQAGSPAGSTDEPAHIAALREQARQLRDTAEARFRAAEPACYERFLVNRCLDQAREARLADIARARALEIEASQLTLARKQRAFLERHGEPATAARPPDGAAIPAPLALPEPADDSAVEALRAAREAAARRAEAEQRARQTTLDAERTEARIRAEAAAAERAERAARDRERYDERLRKHAAEAEQNTQPIPSGTPADSLR